MIFQENSIIERDQQSFDFSIPSMMKTLRVPEILISFVSLPSADYVFKIG